MTESDSDNAQQQRIRAIVHGRVQGVGFRYAAQVLAMNLGLTGYVRNRWNGTVEVVAEGSHAQIDRLVRWLHRGPSAAYVTDVELAWQSPLREFGTFEVRF